MLYKKIILFGIFLSFALSTNAQLNIETSKTTGALTKISNPKDEYAMNWIFASGDVILTWQKTDQD